jgi:tape measure domain-containing protein
MAVTVAEGVVRVTADARPASEGIADQLQGGASKIGSVGKGIGKAFAVGVGAVAGVALAGVGAVAGIALSKGLDRAISIQDAQAKLTGLGHSGTEVQTIMDNALASVKGTAYGLGDAAGVAAGAVAAGIKPGKDLTDTLKLVADSATIAGTDMGSMGSIFNKVAASGKLQGDVIAQLQDAGVPVLQFVAKQIGKTAEETSKLASEGKIDFATFSAAMQSGLGGAALASGNTARGAFANVQAALGRLGVGFAGAAVAGAPQLFTSIGGAVDRLTASLKPMMDRFNAFVTATIPQLSTRIDAINFDAIVTRLSELAKGVQAIFGTIVHGNGFSFDLSRAFGLDKAPMVWQIAKTTHDVLAGALDVAKILGGDGSNKTAANLAEHFGLDKAPTIYAVAKGIHDSIAGMLSGFSGQGFNGIGGSLSALAPAFQSFASQLPDISGAVAKLAGAGITTLSNVLGFLADHVDTIIRFMPLIVAGFVAWQVASRAVTTANMALRAAEVAAIPAQITRNALRLAAATLEYRTAAATRASTAATLENAAATNTGMLATARQAVATAGSRIAMAAGAVATGVATAAQWAWNAALTANPIGIVVVAIAALVAGLVWFFTQTKLGQQIWAGFVGFIVDSWGKVTSFFTDVWNNLVSFFSTWGTTILAVIAPFIGIPIIIAQHWDQIVATVTNVWSMVVSFVTAYVQTLQANIAAGLAFVQAVWSAGLNAIMSVARAVWSAIVAVVTVQINMVMAVVSAVINTTRAVWSAGWAAVQAIVAGAVSGVVNAARTLASGISAGVNAAVNAARGFASNVGAAIGGVISLFVSLPGRITGALGGLGGELAGMGRNLMQGFINGVTGMASRLVAAVTGPIKDAVSGAKALLGIHSPSKVFQEIGDFVGQGLVLGLNGSMAPVSRAAGSMSNAVMGAFGASGSINGTISGVPSAGVAMAGNSAASSGRVANYNVTVNEATDPLGSEGRIRKAFDMYGRM